jgi:hypothetical protein
MKGRSILIALVALLCLAAGSSHADDGTTITSGAMEFEQTSGIIDVSGQSGFRMHAGVDVSGGIYGPWQQCSVPECGPGTEVTLFAHWVGLDLRGTVRLQGHNYQLGSESEGGAMGSVEFDGSVVMPPFNEGGTATVSAPFTFIGQVTPNSTDGSAPTEPLSGGGIATLQLSINFDGSSWNIDRATYQFSRRGAPTTE